MITNNILSSYGIAQLAHTDRGNLGHTIHANGDVCRTNVVGLEERTHYPIAGGGMWRGD